VLNEAVWSIETVRGSNGPIGQFKWTPTAGRLAPGNIAAENVASVLNNELQKGCVERP
jgi:hypothetical protein